MGKGKMLDYEITIYLVFVSGPWEVATKCLVFPEW